MSHSRPVVLGRRRSVMLAALVMLGVATAGAQTAVRAAPPGRIDFDSANLPPATVEVDITQGMFGDLSGIGDAAIAGVADALSNSAKAGEGGEDVQLAAKKLAAARELVQLASKVVEEARVRVYEGAGKESPDANVAKRFDAQLESGNWDKVVRVHDGDDHVQVALLRADGAIRGVFVIVADGDDLVLVNLVCDVSPERVKQLTSTATRIGLENGLGPMIEEHMREMHPQWPDGPGRNRQSGRGR